MKRQTKVSSLTLELYLRGLATYKERKQVENALKTDNEFRKRYETVKKLDHEINQAVTQELSRLNIGETPPSIPPRRTRLIWVLAAAALFLLCAGIPLLFYLKNNGTDKGNTLVETNTEETSPEDKSEETRLTENVPETAPKETSPLEQPKEKEKIAETTRGGNITPNVPSPAVENQPSGAEIAAVPAPDNGVRMRGGEDQRGSAAAPVPESNLNIPPGITFIFENMFSNKNLNFIVIPSQITSIGKNAFAGNPIVSVTIGANVNVDDEAIPGNFAKAYNANGKKGGTYVRNDNNSAEWKIEN